MVSWHLPRTHDSSPEIASINFGSSGRFAVCWQSCKDAGARIHSESNRLLQQCSEWCLCGSSPTTAVRSSLCCASDSENTEIWSHLSRYSWGTPLAPSASHGLVPLYLIDMIGLVAKEPGWRHLRSAAHGDLVVPASRTKTLGSRAFAISGPDSWNNIPVALDDTALSFHEFCVKLKMELYRQINWNWTISAFVTVSTVRSFVCVEQILHTYLLTYCISIKMFTSPSDETEEYIDQLFPTYMAISPQFNIKSKV